MSNPVTLTLATAQGRFIFSGAEVPEKITIGGDQMLTTHKLVGGLRVVEAMGPDDHALSWSGWFLGAADAHGDLPDAKSATGRARFLDYVRRTGLPCTLTWGEFSYLVVVSKFTADYEKPYKVPFQITCEVVQDRTQDVSAIADASPADAVNADAATLGTLAAAVGIPALSAAVAAATSALAAVAGAAKPIANGLVSLGGAGGAAAALGGAAGATSAVASALGATSNSTVTSALNGAISSASSALAAVQGTVSGLIASAEAAVAAIPTIGGLNPLQSVAQQATAMAAQAASAAQLSSLTQIGAVAARLSANLPLVANPGGNRQVSTGGGNLYSVAATAYGDATRWSDIAQASNISDPMTTGFNILTIPS